MSVLYSDNFNGTSLSKDWVFPNGGLWTVNANVLNCVKNPTDTLNPFALLLRQSVVSSFPYYQIISCMVRVNSFDTTPTNGVYDYTTNQAGVLVANNNDTFGGIGFSLMAQSSTEVVISNGYTQESNVGAFWQTGVWYYVKAKWDGQSFWGKVYPITDQEPGWTYGLSSGGSNPFGRGSGLICGRASNVDFKQFLVQTIDSVSSATLFTSNTGMSITGSAEPNDVLTAPLTITGTGVYTNSAPMSVTGGPGNVYAPLYVEGSDVGNAGIPLYIDGSIGNLSLTASLYMGQINYGNHSMNLFVKQNNQTYELQANHPPLYVRGTVGVESVGPAVPLYLNGFVSDISKTFNLFLENVVSFGSLPLLVTGDVSSTYRSYNNTPLSIDGFASFSSGVVLSVYNGNTSLDNVLNPVNMIISGPLGINSSTPNPKNPPLYVSGAVYQAYEHPLTYLYLWAGGSRCESVGLFLQTDPIPTLPFSLPILMNGSNLTGNFRVVPLNIIGSIMGRTMNLIISGKDSGGTSKVLKFSIGGGNPALDGSTPLVLFNNDEWAELNTSFYIRGDGVNMGYYPANASIGFYIQRGPQNGITLVMYNQYVGNTVPFFIYGAPSVNASLPINIAGYGDVLNSTLSLEIYGDVFKQIDSQCTLVMPSVIGFVPDSADLYTNGFNY